MNSSQPVQPQSREVEILRALFDRDLKGRAVALAESRWPGSGPMVDLAYEWSGLSPTERRARLSEIGPEQIARLRSLSALHPEFDAAVTELDRRGVLPHLEAAAQAGVESAAGEPASEPATSAGPEPADSRDNGRAQVEAAQEPPVAGADTEPEPVPGQADGGQVPSEATPEGFDADDFELEEIDVDMPQLDLGLPTTAEFLSAETERRARAFKDAEAALERVRQRLDRSAARAVSRGLETRQPDVPAMAPVALPEIRPAGGALPTQEGADSRQSTMVEAPEWLVEAFAEDIVVMLVEPRQPPGDDELVALANALGVGLKEFRIEPGSLREVYGGLVNRGGLIDVEAGPLPSAIAGKNLAVVRGRIYPSVLKRLQRGYADIPGTRATVQLHEKARVLVIPGG